MELQAKIKNLIKKVKKKIWLLPLTLPFLNTVSLASSTISTAEVETATKNIRDAVIKLAMPIGSVLIFVSIVLISVKMIVNSNNANKRTESVGSLAWVCAGAMLLGLALVVAGIVVGIATNGTNGMITGG